MENSKDTSFNRKCTDEVGPRIIEMFSGGSPHKQELPWICCHGTRTPNVKGAPDGQGREAALADQKPRWIQLLHCAARLSSTGYLDWRQSTVMGNISSCPKEQDEWAVTNTYKQWYAQELASTRLTSTVIEKYNPFFYFPDLSPFTDLKLHIQTM